MATHFAAIIYHLQYSSYDAFHASKHGAVFRHKSNLKSFNALHAIHAPADVAAVVRYRYDP